MHLIMNALEEVTSCAHPNVSEISLLITLMSVSEFQPAKKKKKRGENEKKKKNQPNEVNSNTQQLCSSQLFHSCCFL